MAVDGRRRMGLLKAYITLVIIIFVLIMLFVRHKTHSSLIACKNKYEGILRKYDGIINNFLNPAMTGFKLQLSKVS